MTEDDIKKPGSTAAVFGCAGELVACTRKWAQRSARMMGPAERQAIEQVLMHIAEIVVGPMEFVNYEKAQALIGLACNMEHHERGAYQQNGERAFTNAAEQLEQAVKQPEQLLALPSDVATILRNEDVVVEVEREGKDRALGLYLVGGNFHYTKGFANLQELCGWVRSPEGKLELAGTD